jgi:hypothetical protein
VILFKVGEAVAWRTQDIHGYQWYHGTVMAHYQRPSRVSVLVSHPSSPEGTTMSVPWRVLTRIKTVWADTMKSVR